MKCLEWVSVRPHVLRAKRCPNSVMHPPTGEEGWTYCCLDNPLHPCYDATDSVCDTCWYLYILYLWCFV